MTKVPEFDPDMQINQDTNNGVVFLCEYVGYGCIHIAHAQTQKKKYKKG